MKKEEWKEIPGFDRYQVSSHGRVKSKIGNEKILKPQAHRNTLKIGLKDETGKTHTFTVSRLVLRAFVGPIPDGLICVPKDGDKKNCRLENLKLIPQKPITAYAQPKKLCKEDVIKIRMLVAHGVSMAEAGRIFKVSRQQINQIILGRSWVHV